ncbi:MAG: hypothetical protein ACOZAK_03225 [Patescibacteria group bacterium]
MKNFLKIFTIKNLWNSLPLLVVIATAVTTALVNIKWGWFYSGWDNVHPEFDLIEYARQVFFGAWSEHQSLGAPSAQGQLAEIFRLPLIFLLSLFVPVANLRLVFIFLMFLVGGVGIYFYLKCVWLNDKNKFWQSWLASLGAVFYLLHILTLQQFYISFEMFMVQFAFLPFLLLSIHFLLEKITAKSILYFLLLQFLIAPSAHTQTVFYLAVIFSLLYAFFLTLQKHKIVKAIQYGFLVGLITFFANSYWILPNLYYSFHNAHYVQESRDNQLFAPESVWSIREAGTIENLTSGKHYLFTWQDYNFSTKKHELIFNEWQDHLNQPIVIYLMKTLGVITLFGFVVTIFAQDKSWRRWAVLLFYIFCLVFVWIDLLPTNRILDQLYQSPTFREAFRNPFTKLSILYSFVSVILFITVVEKTVLFLVNLQKLKFFARFLAVLIFFTIYISPFVVAWPSFQGHFISEKLQIKYPDQYWVMFDYLKTRDKDLRILQLPQFTHAGWELYDWQFLAEENGYQGMGFYFFGFPQAFLNRDSDRWVETSDFFYYELKHVLDAADTEQFSLMTRKYNVDLVIIDETRVDPSRDHDLEQTKELLTKAGFKQVWQQDFLTIYERQAPNKEAEVLVPAKLSFVTGDTERVRTDFIYQQIGDYVLTDQADLVYPFADLMSHRLTDVIFEENNAKVWKYFKQDNYQLTIPALTDDQYLLPATISYQDRKVTVDFPHYVLLTEKQQIDLAKLENFEFSLSDETIPNEMVVFFNDFGVIVQKGETVFPIIEFEVGEEIKVEYAPKPEELDYNQTEAVSGLLFDTTELFTFTPNWSELTKEVVLDTHEIRALGLISIFPTLNVDLTKNPSINCVTGEIGEIETVITDNKVIYQAKDRAVNCNGYTFKDVSAAYSYVMRVAGRNYQGRGTKFFINYSNRNILPEDYLEQKNVFDLFITLGQVTTDARDIFSINWETRSFGKESMNALEKIQLQPLPLKRLAQITLKNSDFSQLTNNLTTKQDKKYLDSIFKIDYRCEQAPCFVGIDQTYDDLWLGIDWQNKKLVQHLRLNNWANLWQVPVGDNSLLVVYLPEIIALASLTIVVLTFISLVLVAGLSGKRAKLVEQKEEELAE